MLPERYQKVIVHQFNSEPQRALKIVEVDMRMPSANEILVKNHYAGVNATDIARMMGIAHSVHNTPYDLGVEALGEIVAVGSSISEYELGDIVVTALPGNGYREYSTIDANFSLKLPGLRTEYLGLFISGVLAKIALEYIAEIKLSERVMVTSALSSSGHYAVQLAKAAQCFVIGSCANAEEAAILEDLGADRVINRSKEEIGKVLAQEFPGKLDVIYDSIGGSVLDACLAQTASRARVILTEALREHLRTDAPLHQIDLYNRIIQCSVSIHGLNLLDYANAIPIEGTKLLDLFELGLIKSVIDPNQFTGLNGVISALTYVSSGQARGKVMVKIIEN